MKAEDFKHIDHFTAKEIRRTGAKLKDVDIMVIYHLNILRGYLGIPIKITCLSTGKHTPKSYHYVTEDRLCWAVDFKLCPGRGRKMPPKNKVVQAMLDAGFTGIGIYSTFYHGDIRGYYALWKRVRGIYLPLVS